MLYDDLVKPGEYICHHGIKGQKWGVRRFQNEDGSLTDLGMKRYLSNNGITLLSRYKRYRDIHGNRIDNGKYVRYKAKEIASKIPIKMSSNDKKEFLNLQKERNKYYDTFMQLSKKISKEINAKIDAKKLNIDNHEQYEKIFEREMRKRMGNTKYDKFIKTNSLYKRKVFDIAQQSMHEYIGDNTENRLFVEGKSDREYGQYTFIELMHIIDPTI